MERVLTEYGVALRAGAIFLDPDAKEPSVLGGCWRGPWRMGVGTVIGKRLVRRPASRRPLCPLSTLRPADLKAPEATRPLCQARRPRRPPTRTRW